MTNIHEPEGVFGWKASFFAKLLMDVDAAMKRREESDNQSNRRDVTRAASFATEGIFWILRQHVIGIAEESAILTHAERMALAEMGYQVSETGKVTEQPRYQPTLAIFRLTVRIAMRLNPELSIRFDTKEWEAFRQAIAIRNRITHPKSETDIHVSDEDVDTVIASLFWILDVATATMAAANEALAQRLHEIRTVCEGLKKGDPDMLRAYREAIDRS